MKFKRHGVITKKQADTGKFIKEFIEKHGYQPTFKDIANHFGLKSKSSAWHRYNFYLKNLKKCPFCEHKLKL